MSEIVQSLRPLGASDLAALFAKFEKNLAAWAHAWIATPEWKLQSVLPCRSRDFAAIQERREISLTLLGRSASIYSKQANLVRVGRLCVLGGDEQLGDTRLDAEMSALGLSVLSGLVKLLLDLPDTFVFDKSTDGVVCTDTLGFGGVVLHLSVGTVELFVFLARDALASKLPSLNPVSQKLRPAKLPVQLGQTPCSISVHSHSFEIPIGELLALRPGDVLTMEQGLDTSFEMCVNHYPDMALKAYPGRVGAHLAVEIFENS